MPRWPILVTAAAMFLSAPALAGDPNKPHPHQGVLAPFTTPTKPALTEDDEAKLASGKTVTKQSKGKGESTGGRGIAVQDIHASVDTVWGRITDYNAYARMVDDVDECNIYATEGEHVKARFLISSMFVNIEYFIDHTYRPDDGYMTWTLDYSRESDLDDSIGYWLVEAHPTKPGWTRVYYSIDVRLKGWVPGAIENMIAKTGLTKATAWVKKESEGAQ